MGNIRHPRRGSMQYWPRKRAKASLARIRTWVSESKTKPLAFIGYKAGMTHVMAIDNHPKSLTKGEQIAIPTSIIECPPMRVAGLSFYKNTADGWKKTLSFLSPNVDKELSRHFPLPKKPQQSFPAVESFDDLRLLVHTVPAALPNDAKKPQPMEVALGGSKDEKIKSAQALLGKEIAISDVFAAGNSVDIHGITKGKGFQGTVKRYGVPIRQHKAEKTKRGIATLGSWHPNRVEFTVAQSGKMGYHLRTEYNKQILKIGTNGQDVTPKSGLQAYGIVHSPYLLVKGSIVGSKKRAVILTPSIRPNHHFTKDAPEIKHISVRP